MPDANENTFNHYSFDTRGIIKGFTKNGSGTFFAKIALPAGANNNQQQYINVNAVVGKSPPLQALASALCDIDINEGRGTAAELTLSNLRASHSFTDGGSIRSDDNDEPFINYSAFLNRIAF